MKPKFINKNYKKHYNEVLRMSKEEKDLFLLTSPDNSRNMIIALILLFDQRIENRSTNIDDWECDLENAILPPKKG